MSERVALVRTPEARAYDHGPQHPLRPDRVLLTWSLIDHLGLSDRGNVTDVSGRRAAEDELKLVHTAEFLDATERAGHGEHGDWWRYGYGPGDNPIFPNMHEAGSWVAGASLAAAEEVWSGRAEHAFNAAGGLHHAMPERASGFCVYDDPAIAIRWLLEQGAARIAYVDVDVHHGDGPQAIFYDDPRVLTVSIHQSGRYLFPGTGFVEERGRGEAEGTKVNVPLAPDTGDDGWLHAFREVVPPLVTAWKPDVLVSQLGVDTHHSDPLANLRLTTNAYREAAAEMHRLAHDAANGRWVATGGGGYQWGRVVPRAWTIYFAEMAGAAGDVPDELPEAWIEEAEQRLRGPVPETLSEPRLPEGRGDIAVAGILVDVKRTIFPHHGLG